MIVSNTLKENTVFHTYVQLYERRVFRMIPEDDDAKMAIQRDDSVADEVHAAKMYILGKYNEQEGRDNLTTASAAAAPEIADLTGDDDVQAVEAKPDKNEAPKIMCVVCLEDIPEPNVVRSKRVRCPGERCFTLFSSEQFRFLVDPATKFYDFDMFASLLRKEQVDDILGATSHNEACPFCYYIENFEGLPKQRHPLFQRKNNDCGKLNYATGEANAGRGNVGRPVAQMQISFIDERFAYYCGESLVANTVEDDIRAAQNAKEKAEDALKGLLAEPGGGGAATAQLKQQLIQLKATHARKVQAADDKAYKHFDRSATTIYKKEKCPLYSNIDQLRCIKQFQCTKMTESRIRENCPGYNEDVLNSLVEKQLEEQNKR
ncbi:unnamed protein product [Clonostachys rosea f. rosea IK726]|uniref:Uncharacterized protein n=1 Tax=Clonostachys rosea f. rosea IK726 TaxID=1349383 RepID=A0ACA9UR37_BIOOC|nr:unnamed protein product [Clonostachys rosea f. rosea IK726]